jgi:hypothetical protein
MAAMTAITRDDGDDPILWLILRQHHFGRLNYCLYFIPRSELHFLNAADGNNAFHQVIADANGYVGHYSAQFNVFNDTFELVSG